MGVSVSPSRDGSSPAHRIRVRTAASASSRLGRLKGLPPPASAVRADKVLTAASMGRPPAFALVTARQAAVLAFLQPALYIGVTDPYHNERGPKPTPMLNEIYNKRILELAADIPRLGRLDAPDASARAHSKLCGSTVTVDLKVLEPVRDYKARHTSTMLTFDAVVDALNQIEARQAAPAAE